MLTKGGTDFRTLFLKKTSGNKGLTLIEVMVSIMILSVIVLAFFPLFTYTASNVVRSEKFIEIGERRVGKECRYEVRP